MRLPECIESVPVSAVRASSHRARDRLSALVGHRPASFFRWLPKHRGTTFVEMIPTSLLDKAAEIPGVTIAQQHLRDDAWHTPWS